MILFFVYEDSVHPRGTVDCGRVCLVEFDGGEIVKTKDDAGNISGVTSRPQSWSGRQHKAFDHLENQQPFFTGPFTQQIADSAAWRTGHDTDC